MKVIRSVSLPATPVIFFSFLFLGFLGKVSSLILAPSFCIMAQTANRILEEECLVAIFSDLLQEGQNVILPPLLAKNGGSKNFQESSSQQSIHLCQIPVN